MSAFSFGAGDEQHLHVVFDRNKMNPLKEIQLHPDVVHTSKLVLISLFDC